MPTVRVSNSTQLLSALKAAGPETRIELTSGTYSLSARTQDFSGAVIAPAAGADVAFSKLYLYSVKHLSFTGVDFLGRPGESKPFVVAKSVDVAIHDATFDGHTANGYGAGHGLWLSKTNGFTLADSRVHDFATGLWIAGTSNLIVSGNTLSNISQDAMIVGRRTVLEQTFRLN